MRFVPILLALALFACAPKPGIVHLAQPGGPPVRTGWYEGRLDILAGGDPLVKRAQPWRRDIACRETVLRQLVRMHYDAKAPLEFNYMYTGLDRDRDLVLIRYFAPAWNPKEIAGWDVIVCHTRRGRVVEAWVNELPLE